MKVEIKVKKWVDITLLEIDAGVRYWEDATINGIEDENGTLTPCKIGDRWKPLIDIDNGQIINWEEGKEADIHFKVCDDGSYYLKDNNGDVILSIEDNYVPNIACTGGNGYGDYIIMKVDKFGNIANFKRDISDFFVEE